MDNIRGVRPKMPKLQSDLAKFSKREVISEAKQAKNQATMDKALKKREVRMAKLEKRKEIAQAVENLKTLRMELKMIK